MRGLADLTLIKQSPDMVMVFHSLGELTYLSLSQYPFSLHRIHLRRTLLVSPLCIVVYNRLMGGKRGMKIGLLMIFHEGLVALRIKQIWCQV